jgi:transposase
MRYYTGQHSAYCGVDLHARSMYLCVLDATGQTLLHQNYPASPETFLAAIAPFRAGLVVGCECMFAWYWLADLCAREQLPFVLGHALGMKAVHGGKSKNDRLDAATLAGLLRGGLFPQAYVYPAAMRETRDLLRRRTFLVRQRSHLLAHVQNTNSQYNLPPFDFRLARPSAREHDTIVSRFTHPSLQLSMRTDLELIDVLDDKIRALEGHLTRHAKIDDPVSYHLLRTIPGVGPVLALILLYEIHDIGRFDHAGQFLSYARLVTPRRESGGKVVGSGKKKVGNAHLRWACAEAALLLLRDCEPAKRWRQRIEKKKGAGKSLAILAAKLGRAVYLVLKRKQPFDLARFLGASAAATTAATTTTEQAPKRAPKSAARRSTRRGEPVA